jgi:ribosome biogenesis GTPase
MKGNIYKSTGTWYYTRDETGKFWNTRIKGKMKIDGEISSTNPIAVGDYVEFAIEDEAAGTGIISAVDARRNYIVRVSPHNRNQKHIIASNIDLAAVIVTVTGPRTSTGFIDRFLLTAEAYHIPAVILVNKCDLLNSKHLAILEQWKQMYGYAGYRLVELSATQPETLLPLRNLLKDKVTLFSGHSGVGKSTLINQLIPGKELRTGEISGYSGKGQHTTTFAEMFSLPDGGRIIDTPGVKEFGLIDIEKEEVAHYFPEMKRLIGNCRFNNCMHLNEPGCAVLHAVENGDIDVDRYGSYLSILNSIEDKWS